MTISAERLFDSLIRVVPMYLDQKNKGWTPILISSAKLDEVCNWLETNSGPRYNPQPKEDQEIKGEAWGTWNMPTSAPGRRCLFLIKDRRVAARVKLIYG